MVILEVPSSGVDLPRVTGLPTKDGEDKAIVEERKRSSLDFTTALEEIQKVEQSHDIDLVRVQESVTQVQNLLAETKEMMSEMRNSARTEKESILRELREETRRVTSEVVSNALTSATVSVAQGTPQLRMSVAAVLETGAETIRAMPEADGGNPNVQ